VLRWLVAFAFTQVVEVPLWVFVLGRQASPKRSLATRALIAFGASALTHPIVWFVFPRIVPFGYVVMVALAETFAVVAEAFYTRAFGLRRALICSLLINGASAGLGFACRSAFGWP
jgi:hypothetical protein